MKLPVGALLASTVLVITAATDYDAAGRRWWRHVQALANDQMEGRNTGSEGHRKAAAYVAGEFARNGLTAAGTQGYVQPLRLTVSQIEESQSSLRLIRDGKAKAVKLGEEAIISMHADCAPHTQAEAAFAGYGLGAPEAGWDDFAGVDWHGKLAVLLGGRPQGVPELARWHYQSLGERWKRLKAAGALGLATIPNPDAGDIPYFWLASKRLEPVMALADPALDEMNGLGLHLTINPTAADLFLAGTGHTLRALLQDAGNGKPLAHFPLRVTIDATVKVKKWHVESQNVAGILSGSDAKLKDEYVVLSAHLDHVGRGEPVDGDAIYNGAMDNAAGIASIVEIGRMLKEVNRRAKRAILFLAVTAEEQWMLGSSYFTARPTVPPGKIVADLNLDMFLPLYRLRYLEAVGLEASNLGDDLRAVAKEAGVGVYADPQPVDLLRSDQYSFLRRGIPAMALKFGYMPNSAEQRLHRDWLETRYHAPSDDLKQPVDQAAAARFNEIVLHLAERIANAPERPRWKADVLFGRGARAPH